MAITRSMIKEQSKTNSRILAIRRKYDKSNSWTEWEPILLLHDSSAAATSGQHHNFPLHRGKGCTLKVYPNLVDIQQCDRIKNELLTSGLFRRYKIQGTYEPRVHFLLHEDATDNVEDELQPGYKYAKQVTMKARPLSTLKEVQELSEEMKMLCNVDKWTIGVNPVLYRGYSDRMGDHADDDQGEDVILAVVIASPSSSDSCDETRKIYIKPQEKNGGLQEGDEEIILSLNRGDAYEMNGEMQKHYSHSVPPHTGKNKNASITHSTVRATATTDNSTQEQSQDKSTTTSSTNHQRIVIVFRTGDCVYTKKDGGKKCVDLSPSTNLGYTFGPIEWLEEGKLYSREELQERGGHRANQRSISGNKEVGCDAIIISGLREDGKGKDLFIKVTYAVEKRKGAGSVITSMESNKPIRIFRTTRYAHYLGAKRGDDKTAIYRYDGLYFVEDKLDPDKERDKYGPYHFFLQRCDEPLNQIPTEAFISHCKKLGTILGDDYINHPKYGDAIKRNCDHSFDVSKLQSNKAKKAKLSLLDNGFLQQKEEGCTTTPNGIYNPHHTTATVVPKQVPSKDLLDVCTSYCSV